MKKGKTSPSSDEAWFGDVAIVGGSSVIESVEIQRLLPCLTEEKQVNVFVHSWFRYNR